MGTNYCISCMASIGSDAIACPRCGFVQRDYVPQPLHLPSGAILNGKYLTGKVLGEGGFGITYVGIDLALEKKVAIKEFCPRGCVTRNNAVSQSLTCLASKNFTRTFERGKEKCISEARAMAKLDEIPQVVRVRDYFIENNTAYIIMDFIEGQTLKHILHSSNGKMEFSRVMDIMLPLISAMQLIHDIGVLHRDISPDNIMLTPNGKVKILDFGAAKNVIPSGHSIVMPTIKRGFSPLEQYSTSGNQGTWTDVYAMCATIYYMATGRTAPEPLDRLDSETLKRPETLGVQLSKSQSDAIVKGLAVKPEERIQTMSELYCALTLNEPSQTGTQNGGRENDIKTVPLQRSVEYQYTSRASTPQSQPSVKDKKISSLPGKASAITFAVTPLFFLMSYGFDLHAVFFRLSYFLSFAIGIASIIMRKKNKKSWWILSIVTTAILFAFLISIHFAFLISIFV